MKTVTDLNSKWFWRLIKVLYFLFLILAMVILGFIFYDSLKIFNPLDIEKLHANTDEIYNLKNNINLDYWDYVFRDEIIQANDINKDIVILKTMWIDIEGITFEDYWYNDAWECELSWILLENYKNWTNIYLDSKKCYSQQLYDMLRYVDNWESSDYLTKQFYTATEGWYIDKNYFWLLSLIKLLLYLFISFLILAAISFLLRWIIFYIILGKIIPKN